MTARDDRTRLALIGLGDMGEPLARRLADVGAFDLTVFDLRPERVAALAGVGRAAASVGEAARGADVVLTVLPADAHVEAVAAELSGDGVLVDLSTIAPGTIEAVASRVGMTTVSVAITRGTAAARRGELALFVGVDGELPVVVRDVLSALAAELLVVDGLGAAKALKIVNNMLLACLDIAICEALVIARRMGLSDEDVVSRLAEAGADSWALRNHVIRHVLTDDLGPGHFSTVNMAKDVALFLDLAARGGEPAPLAGVAAAAYRGVIAIGLGEHYHPVVIRWLERAAGDARGGLAPPAGALDVIAAGVVAVQALAGSEALAVAAGAGLERGEAARLLDRGSAANPWLAGVARDAAGPRDAAAQPDHAVAAALAGALDLATAAAVPAHMLEAARHAVASRRSTT